MIDPRETRRYGNNNPIHTHQARWDGYRSIRLAEEDIGLATTAYSYALSYDELPEVAERLALLWNLHLGESNDDLRRALSPSPQTKEGE